MIDLVFVIFVDAFEKARGKGIVGPEGESGIKLLKGKGIKKGDKIYTGLLSIDWTQRIERITQMNGTYVRIDWV
ncbi:hypothetical protein [Paenibacillus apiarius]|uniref:Uncharacterized protein n=1 Tax=Paenibacillus apiarius TaxID=46240 RepID=A0ABT4E1B0_9BACL|nr:hypothetical protein [Paenibacillus apiarius]MCY9518040.1 hypothetical protein [Paenibacillus apiarius]MCY9523405.1 hypothetical protein [Paenibacillus apiarius]MCY9553701.1 hypothetical protein [Paenibacillus apiarius]MCY9556145.1 hypothetical protein [Paenibacillus apiarius]MCY9681681.1 hypothetical protein [Paenibacillus apiarius]